MFCIRLGTLSRFSNSSKAFSNTRFSLLVFELFKDILTLLIDFKKSEEDPTFILLISQNNVISKRKGHL